MPLNGAGGGTRTHMAVRPTDFKSDMSTIPSRPHVSEVSTLSITDNPIEHKTNGPSINRIATAPSVDVVPLQHLHEERAIVHRRSESKGERNAIALRSLYRRKAGLQAELASKDMRLLWLPPVMQEVCDLVGA